jgi:deazaflavin-dependent oxidoreductase (nitroreductase family)/steroid delta-isomerase-like uncharacterized protein
LLTTVGRHTGKLRTVPVFFLRDGDQLVICNVNPGFEHPNPWTLNLRANPAARVEIRGSTGRVHGRAATEDEVTRYWPLFIDLWPAYQTFFDRGGTRTVFVLEPDRTSTREEKTMGNYRRLLERYTELSNAGDLDGIMDLYAEDAVQVMPDGTFEGRSAIRERLAQDMTAFPDMHFGFVSFIEQGDAFADEFVAVGTHAGSLVLPDGTELPPTGKRVEMTGMELVRVRDGKIVADNLYYDNLAVAAQLGLLPQSVPATAP